MENMSGAMKSLCEEIIRGHEDRKSIIKHLKVQAKAIRNNARKFLADSKKFHEEMNENLRKTLQEDRKVLARNITALREDFKKKEEEVRADLAEGRKLWNKMNKTLRSKKTKFKEKGGDSI